MAAHLSRLVEDHGCVMMVVVCNRHPGKVLCVLWLGSSVGNLAPPDALEFFKSVLQIGGADTQVCCSAEFDKILEARCNVVTLEPLGILHHWL